MKKDILACGLAAAFAVGTMVATAGAEDVPRARVAFDRAGGFTVERGAEASVTARVEDGGGYGFRGWEGNAPGHAEGRRNETWVIDTGRAGEYWLRAIGWCDGTDDEVRGTIRFRVVEPARAARPASEGETLVWSEDFADLTSGSSTVIDYHDWTGDKCYNISNSVRVGSSNGGGYVTSTNGTLGGSSGRLEFSMWRHDSGAAATLQRSVDGGDNWIDLATYSSSDITASAQVFSVDVPASETVMFKWSNDAGRKRFYLDDVSLYSTGSVVPQEPHPPVLDLDPDVSEVTVFVGQEYELEVTATEYDGDEITLSASGTPVTEDTWLADDPGTGSVTGYFNWTPTTTGTWNVVFSATDKDGTTNRTVAFTVVPEGPGSLAFESDGVHVRESAGTVTLTVVRTNGAAGAVTVAWATLDGTASAGSEYVAGGGALAFADGQTEATLSVALLDDTAAEDNKSFSVVLGNVTGGASLGDVTACTVTIVDDDDANASYYASCYKNGVLKTGDDLKDALCKILNTGVKTNTYGSRLDDILQVTDRHSTNGSSSQVRCIYLQSGITAFNKEHIWAQSHGIDESGPAYSDLHHIRACNSTMNSTRGDKDFDNRQNVSGATQVNGCWYTSKAWEPPDAAKGDVARAVLYMDVRYENKYNGKVDLEAVDSIGTSTDGNQLGKLSTLIAWNELDPPDAFEKRRNELIYTTYQYNRNPFIDHPTWVRAVFDPTNFHEEAITWTVNVTVEGTGWVNGDNGASTTEVTNGLTKTFFVQPDAASYYHIGSISWNGVLVPQAYYTNASYYNYTTPVVTNTSTLAVVFAPDTAALGTPIWWLAQYGYTNDWDAAELADLNDDGVPNWQEYLNGTDPTALSLRQVTGVTVTATNNAGFTLTWNAVDYADGYRVRVCSTAVVDATSAGFEDETLDSGWTVSATGTALATNAALEGEWGLTFSTNGAWLASPAVANPASVEFKYKRSSSTAAWILAVEVSADGGGTWTEAGSVTNATTTAKTGSVDLSAWYGQTVIVRLRDARESGNAARYVDAVTLKTGGATVAEATTSATTWTATGLDAGTGYDVFVRGEATTLGTAVGPWSAAVRATTAEIDDGRQAQTITFPAIADQLTTATVTLQATASSGLAVSYVVDGPAVLAGMVLSFTDAGTVTVTASQSGNAEWKPAASVTRTFAVTEPVLAAPENVRASSTNAMGFTAAWNAVEGATGYRLTVWRVSEGSGEGDATVLVEDVCQDINGNGNARLTNGTPTGWVFTNAYAATNEIRVGTSGAGGSATVTGLGATGTVRVVTRARTWATDSNVVMSVTVGGALQTNSLTTASETYTNDFEGVDGEVAVGWSCAAAKKRFFLQSVEVGVIGAGGTGGAVREVVEGYDGLAVAGLEQAVTGLEAETAYEFQVSAVAGTTAGPGSAMVAVSTLAAGTEKREQTITFPSIGAQVTTNTVTLAATADSGLPVSYAVVGPAAATGGMLTFTGAGQVTVTASQAGDDEWLAADDVTQSFEVSKAQATVTLGGLSWTYDGTGKMASVTTEPEGVQVALTYDGGTELPVNAGSHPVAATVVDEIWAGQAEGTMVIAKGTQTITFGVIGTQTTADTVTLGAVASSGLEVSYSFSGPAQLAGTTLSFTGAGTVTVTASQAGDENWAAAEDAVRSFEVTKAALTPQEAYEEWLDEKVANPEAPELSYETATEDDADEDGVSNWLEYVADTDPTDGEVFLHLKVVQTNGTWFAKPEPASANRSYSIVTRTDLVDDSTLKTNSFPAGSVDPTTAITNDIWFGTIRVSLPE